MIRIERAPAPKSGAIRAGWQALMEKRGATVNPNDLHARDEEFLRRIEPLLSWLYDDYLRCETELECDLPEGPCLVVGNHNGMTGTPDMFCHMVAFWRRYGFQRRAHGLMHDFPFNIPWAGSWLSAAGALAANHDNGQAALAEGAAVLVFPGGDIDACKPYRERYRIDFAGRRGFLKLALRAQVPIVPCVSAGAHSSLLLLSDGQSIAKFLRLPRLLRSNVFPIGFALPYGLVVGTPLPHLPPPVKVHTRFLRPVEFGLPASAAEDPEALDACYVKVVMAMQKGMDDLRRAGRHGLFPRKREAAGS